MATEIAKAYVQIMPSAKGIKGALTKELSGESASAGMSAGGKIASSIKGAIAAAGIGTALKAAITEGAALEQSIGGIETLFKGSADTVKRYAEDAYKTAGLSANEYMETVTSFSASLISSLGGDTAAAAETANMAITDMSDNANKMGTSMEDIQNAYQGFAKQNYTMLDNLKLGYGGTKTEMQRLLADAEKISGIHYDISNLDDVYSAIHVIQEELDITGTTAKEAATTLSGSLASMKSSFKNLLGNLALGKDIGPSLTALSETVYTFLVGNLIPMVGNIIKGIPQALSGVLSMAIRGLNLAANNADAIIQSGMEVITQLVVGIVSALPYLGEAAINLVAALGTALMTADWAGMALNLISQLKSGLDVASVEILGTDGNIISAIGTAITNGLPGILEKGIEIITNIANGILINLPTIIAAAGSLMNSLVGFIMSNLPTILQAGMNLAQNLAQGIASNLPAVVSSIAGVLAQLLATIAENLPQLLQSGIELVGELAAGLIEGIPHIIAAIPSLISSAVDSFLGYDWASLGGDIVSGIANGLRNAAGKIKEAAMEAAKNALEAAKDFLGIRSPSRVFRDEVGKMVSLGMAEGIKKNMWAVSGAVDYLTNLTDKDIKTRIRNTTDYNSGKVSEFNGTIGNLLEAVDRLNGAVMSRNNQQTMANFYLGKRLFAKAMAKPIEKELNYNSKIYEMMGGVKA
ncbi:hypothetical protein OCV99_02000 [Dorea acetigenes]|uniref:Phage-related protein n=1 Tax=Dorea acetigenes TaxID=2981787 RepID=A0ABT2RJ15_9FIRM|nr:hypothetical protein [Dorea acetigenes]MCU6685336.1 hypothetical protein [Dorea acetigenes]SCI44157.1 Phage-related protein [uncultured Clostridium sp.]